MIIGLAQMVDSCITMVGSVARWISVNITLATCEVAMETGNLPGAREDSPLERLLRRIHTADSWNLQKDLTQFKFNLYVYLHMTNSN